MDKHPAIIIDSNGVRRALLIEALTPRFQVREFSAYEERAKEALTELRSGAAPALTMIHLSDPTAIEREAFPQAPHVKLVMYFGGYDRSNVDLNARILLLGKASAGDACANALDLTKFDLMHRPVRAGADAKDRLGILKDHEVSALAAWLAGGAKPWFLALPLPREALAIVLDLCLTNCGAAAQAQNWTPQFAATSDGRKELANFSADVVAQWTVCIGAPPEAVTSLAAHWLALAKHEASRAPELGGEALLEMTNLLRETCRI